MPFSPFQLSGKFFRIICFLSLTHFLGNICQAAEIKPVSVMATSEFGAVDFLGLSDVFAVDLIDGGGLIDIDGTPDNALDDLHDFDAFWNNGWHSGDFDAGISGGTDEDGDPFTVAPVEDQILEFNLGQQAILFEAYVWQQNQNGFEFAWAPLRGVDEMEILISEVASGDNFTSLGVFALEPELGTSDVPAQVLRLADDPVIAWRVRFEIISALSGEPNEFVGLGEVRFQGEYLPTLLGDFDGSGVLDVADINLLSAEVRSANPDPSFDLNSDGNVDQDDRTMWVEELANTYFGDANLDGEFNSSDLVAVFTAQRFEAIQLANWQEGDWDGDEQFTSGDFVKAFIGGGYELGPRPNVQAVPEPAFGSMWLVYLLRIYAIRVCHKKKRTVTLV
ncbi:MAG: hypothetical protein KDA87_05660 [Planctomycetales bacterium]|nr:hypothetical protein [Planctomycetales bacterium]